MYLDHTMNSKTRVLIGVAEICGQSIDARKTSSKGVTGARDLSQESCQSDWSTKFCFTVLASYRQTKAKFRTKAIFPDEKFEKDRSRLKKKLELLV